MEKDRQQPLFKAKNWFQHKSKKLGESSQQSTYTIENSIYRSKFSNAYNQWYFKRTYQHSLILFVSIKTCVQNISNEIKTLVLVIPERTKFINQTLCVPKWTFTLTVYLDSFFFKPFWKINSSQEVFSESWMKKYPGMLVMVVFKTYKVSRMYVKNFTLIVLKNYRFCCLYFFKISRKGTKSNNLLKATFANICDKHSLWPSFFSKQIFFWLKKMQIFTVQKTNS